MGRRLGRVFQLVWNRPGRALGVLLLLLALGGVAGAVYRWGYYDFRAAQLAEQQHRLGEARQHVEAYLRLWPRSVSAHFLAARVARRSGALDEAHAHLSACKQLAGEPSEAVKLEGILLQVQGGDISPQTEQYLQERYLDRNVAETPVVLEALAAGYLNALTLPAALDCVDRCLREQPANIPALYLRARTAERLSRPEALDDYRRVLELDPGHRDARLGLAELLLRSGWAEEAEGHFAVLCRRWPEDPAARLGLARCRFHAGQADEARRLLDALVAEDPHNLGALKAQGRLALEAGRAAEAEAWLRRALPLELSDRELRHLLVRALRQQGKAEEARREQEQSDRVAADLKRLQEVLGGETSRLPRDPALLCELATLYLRYGKDEAGVGCLRRALAADPDYGPARQALAEYSARHAAPEGDQVTR
jgi:tetratricopeptide (TPR) repeat protein